jgi:hypothetical protein
MKENKIDEKFSRCELDKQNCLLESRQARSVLSDRINECQDNRSMMSN